MNVILQSARVILRQQPSVGCAVLQLHATQTRNTHVVKHVKVEKLQPSTHMTLKQLEKNRQKCDEEFIYEHVHHSSNFKRKPLEVLLLSTVEGYGHIGEVVSVPPGLARKNLLLPKLAVYASPENLKRYAYLKDVDKSDMPSSPIVNKTISQLGGAIVHVCMNIEEPWEIQPWHIRVAFRKMNVYCTESAIELPETPIRGPNLEFQDKYFYVTVTINQREKVRVRCRLHHVSADVKKKLPWRVLPDYSEPPEAIIPEQATYLLALHRQRVVYTSYNEPQITPDEVEAQELTAGEVSDPTLTAPA